MANRTMAFFAATGLALTRTGGALADGGAPTSEEAGLVTLRVGVTSILCHVEPCPWNGILKAGQPVRPSDVIWSGSPRRP